MVIFGHKDLIYREYKSLNELANDLDINLEKINIRSPMTIASFGYKNNDNKKTAEELLDWALKDLKDGEEKGFSNSISNSKKSISRRIDEIVADILDIKKYNKGYKFLEDKLGLFIPTLLKIMIIDPRNKSEHEFTYTGKEGARNAYEIAKLFLDGTNNYLSDSIIGELELGKFSSQEWYEDKGDIISLSFGRNTRKEGKRFLFTHKKDGDASGKYLIIDSDSDKYLELVIAMLEYKKDPSIDNIRKILLKI